MCAKSEIPEEKTFHRFAAYPIISCLVRLKKVHGMVPSDRTVSDAVDELLERATPPVPRHDAHVQMISSQKTFTEVSG